MASAELSRTGKRSRSSRFSAEERLRQLARLWKIVVALQKGDGRGMEALAEECGCCARTIRRDFETLRAGGVRIEHDPVARGYVLMGTPPIPVLDFTFGEATAVAVTMAAAAATGGLKPEDLTNAFDKVIAVAPEPIRQRIRDAQTALAGVHSARRDYSRAPLAVALAACRERMALEIDYDSRSSSRRWRTVHPYAVAMPAGLWMLMAHDPSHAEVRLYALDRIHDCRLTKTPFTVSDGWSVSAYMRGSVGVLRGKPMEIEVRFDPVTAPYARERAWSFEHEFMGLPDGAVTMRATVAGLEEIAKELLSWGRHAVVVSPPELRKKMADEARAILENHSEE